MELGCELCSDSTVPHGGWKPGHLTSQTKTVMKRALGALHILAPDRSSLNICWIDGWIDGEKKGGYFKIIQNCFLPNLTLDWSLTVLNFPGQITIVL